MDMMLGYRVIRKKDLDRYLGDFFYETLFDSFCLTTDFEDTLVFKVKAIGDVNEDKHTKGRYTAKYVEIIESVPIEKIISEYLTSKDIRIMKFISKSKELNEEQLIKMLSSIELDTLSQYILNFLKTPIMTSKLLNKLLSDKNIVAIHKESVYKEIIEDKFDINSETLDIIFNKIQKDTKRHYPEVLGVMAGHKLMTDALAYKLIKRFLSLVDLERDHWNARGYSDCLVGSKYRNGIISLIQNKSISSRTIDQLIYECEKLQGNANPVIWESSNPNIWALSNPNVSPKIINKVLSRENASQYCDDLIDNLNLDKKAINKILELTQDFDVLIKLAERFKGDPKKTKEVFQKIISLKLFDNLLKSNLFTLEILDSAIDASFDSQNLILLANNNLNTTATLEKIYMKIYDYNVFKVILKNSACDENLTLKIIAKCDEYGVLQVALNNSNITKNVFAKIVEISSGDELDVLLNNSTISFEMVFNMLNEITNNPNKDSKLYSKMLNLKKWCIKQQALNQSQDTELPRIDYFESYKLYLDGLLEENNSKENLEIIKKEIIKLEKEKDCISGEARNSYSGGYYKVRVR